MKLTNTKRYISKSGILRKKMLLIDLNFFCYFCFIAFFIYFGLNAGCPFEYEDFPCNRSTSEKLPELQVIMGSNSPKSKLLMVKKKVVNSLCNGGMRFHTYSVRYLKTIAWIAESSR